MSCRSGEKPHVHRDLECPACYDLRDYEFTEVLEVVECEACGFPIAVEPEFMEYCRKNLELMKRPKFTSFPDSGFQIVLDDSPSGFKERAARTLLGWMLRQWREFHKEPPPWLDGLA